MGGLRAKGGSHLCAPTPDLGLLQVGRASLRSLVSRGPERGSGRLGRSPKAERALPHARLLGVQRLHGGEQKLRDETRVQLPSPSLT